MVTANNMNLVLLMFSVAFTVLWQHPAAVTGANILAIETCGSKSHWQYMLSIIEPLLDAQHQVTAITPLTAGWNRDSYTEIDASSVFPVYGEQDTVWMIERYRTAYKMSPPFPSRSWERDLCDAFYAMPEVKELMRLGPCSGYDLVLLEPFYSSCLSHLAHTLNVSEIYAVPSPIVTPTEKLYFGTESNPLVVANILYSAGGGAPRNGVQRVHNLALYAYVKVVPWMTDTRMRFFDPKPYDVPEVRHKPAAVFVNTCFITEPPRDFPPNMVQIGGIHLKPPGTLPHDILEFIESSPHGVIYFSLGSVASISTLPKRVIEVIVEAFEEIPQKVIWKYEGEIDNFPSSIMSRKWLPQREILLHPNVKLFISHGGISGVYEAVDAAVPVLGFPLFYDQPRNVGNLEDAGMAISMDILTITKDSFLRTLNTLLHDEKYTLNAKHVSNRFKNSSVPFSKVVTTWTDYILTHPTVSRKKEYLVTRFSIVQYNLILYSTIFSTVNLWTPWCC